MNKKAEEKKPTLTQRMDAMETAREADSKRLDKILELMLTKDKDAPEEAPKKEPDRDAAGNVIKYYKFVTSNTELLQMTNKRGYRKPMGPHGDYTLVPPELCSFGRDTDGPPGFFKTADEAQAKRLREKREEQIRNKLQPVFSEVTDDPAFADF